MMATEGDSIKKAHSICEAVKHRYSWSGENAGYTDTDPRKAYEERKGDAADINLALVGALQSGGFNADPVLISTRNHGLPIKVHPQRSSFNYVAARLKIGGASFLLDGTDAYLPF